MIRVISQYNMKKIIILLIVSFVSFSAKSQVYQLMAQYGYDAKRINFDSTLQIPTTCGVPTLKSVVFVNKKSAIAFDSCNNRFYVYNPKTATWSQVSGGTSLDTTSLSNRINSKADSSIGLQKVLENNNIAYGNLIDLYDTINNKTYEIYINPNTSNVALIGMKDSSDNYLVLQTKGSYNTPSIYFINKGQQQYLNQQDSTSGNLFLPHQNISDVDTLALLDDIRNNTIDTTSLSNRINGKADTISYKSTIVPFANAVGILTGDSTALRYDTKTFMIGSKGAIGEEYALDMDAGRVTLFANFNGLRLNVGSGTSGVIDANKGFSFWNRGTRYAYIGSGGVSNHWFKMDSADLYIPKIAGLSDSMAIIEATTGKIKAKAIPSSYSQNGRFGNDTATIVLAKIHNDAGVTLTNGKVVRWSTSGTNSDIPSVHLANNKHDSASANTLGFVMGTINDNDTGYVILSGKIEKLNTGSFTNGDIIYLDSISGQWTKSKPVAPYHMVYLGVVIKANNGNGSIFVKAQNGYELDEIHDVLITSKLNNQILVYSDTLKIWKNKNINSVLDTTSTIATKSNFALKVNISDTANMLTNYQKSATAMKYTDTTSLSNRINSKLNTSSFDWIITLGQQALGSTIKSVGLGFPNLSSATSSAVLTSGTMRFIAIYLPKSDSLTGVKWMQTTIGNYTANNENRIALYTYNAGTLTLVASSTNDGTLWSTATTGTMGSKAFTSKYYANAGLYFIGLLWSASATTNAPSLAISTNLGSVVNTSDFTNSGRISCTTNTTTIPSSISLSTTSSTIANYGAWVY